MYYYENSTLLYTIVSYVDCQLSESISDEISELESKWLV